MTRGAHVVTRQIERLEPELFAAADAMNGVRDVQREASCTMDARERRAAKRAARRAGGDGGAADGTATDQGVVSHAGARLPIVKGDRLEAYLRP